MSRIARCILAAAVMSVGCGACGDNIGVAPVTPFDIPLPPGFPAPKVPENNPLTVEKIELGRHLFYDERLSGNQTQACASCHLADSGFSDPRDTSEGSTGEHTPRNSMTLTNVAYNSTYTWSSPLLGTLEQQIIIPMFGEMPIELGLTETVLIERLEADQTYQRLFAAAFPDEDSPITTMNAVKALASFVRTIISGNSPYDKLTYQGDSSAMSDSAKRGLNLFFSEVLECHHCHNGFNFSQAVTFEGQAFMENGFFNTGLYNVDGEGAYPAPNHGLSEFTGRTRDDGKFKIPTLRNIMTTAPYSHDGSVATIDDVIDNYAAGGRLITEGPNAGDGRASPNKSLFITGFELSSQERADLKAFFSSLTDEEFLRDERFSNPWIQ